MKPKERRTAPRLPQQEAYTLKSLDQIKVLADPLRVRILEALCQERTTKQVADLLGEKPTKLYHHVDALERVGLIELTRTQPNRGTVEKYYLAVARTFRADSRAFLPEQRETNQQTGALQQMISSFLDTTSAELTALFDPDQDQDAMKTIEEEGIISFLEIRGSTAQLRAIREKLNEIIQSVVDDTTDDGSTDRRRCRLTLAFYPLDRGTP